MKYQLRQRHGQVYEVLSTHGTKAKAQKKKRYLLQWTKKMRKLHEISRKGGYKNLSIRGVKRR